MNRNRNTLILVVILVVLAIAGAYAFRKHAAQAPTAAPVYVGPASDRPGDIDAELESIDTGSQLDADLQGTDKDIQAL